MDWRRPFFWVLVLVLLALCWAAYRVHQVYADLASVRDTASLIEADVRDQDVDAARARVDALQDHARGAASGSSGPVWAVLERLPSLGDDARTVATLSRVANDLAREAIPPALRASQVMDGADLIRRGGGVDLGVIERLTPDLTSAHRAFVAADETLGRLETAGNLGKVQDAYTRVAESVGELTDVLSSADTALAVLPSMAGSNEERHYLLALQNNAELRASGGLPGVVVELTASRGKVTLGTPLSASETFKQIDAPILPLTAAEQALYGENLGTYFYNANFTPDFPRTADLMAARWHRDVGTPLDGVLAMDTVTLGYLLEATGPITVDGVRLTPENAVDELLVNTYTRLAGQLDAQDAFFQAVTKVVFARITDGSAEPTELLAAVGRAASEGRVRVRSFHPAEAHRIEGTKVTGTVPRDPRLPQVGVYVNDATNAKMNAFLDYTVRLRSTSCSDSRQTLSGQMTLTSRAPRNIRELDPYITGRGDIVPIGSQRVYLYLYPPPGGRMSEVALDGRSPARGSHDHLGRQVTVLPVLLKARETRHLTWTTTTGPGQTGDVTVEVTPNVAAGNRSSTAPTAC